MATVSARVRQERTAAPHGLDRQLALLIASGGDERIWLAGDAPSLLDINAYMNVWYARGNMPDADTLFAEFDLLGTHLGPLYGVPPTGKTFVCPVVAFFFFDGEHISCERIYFDVLTIMTQLGVTEAPPTG